MDGNNEQLAPNGAGASAGARQQNPAVEKAKGLLERYGCMSKGLAAVELNVSSPIAERIMLAAGADVVVAKYGRSYKFFCSRSAPRDKLAVWARGGVYVIDRDKALAVARKYMETWSMGASAKAVGLPTHNVVYAAVAYLAGDILAAAPAPPRQERPDEKKPDGGQDAVNDIETVVGRR